MVIIKEVDILTGTNRRHGLFQCQEMGRKPRDSPIHMKRALCTNCFGIIFFKKIIKNYKFNIKGKIAREKLIFLSI